MLYLERCTIKYYFATLQMNYFSPFLRESGGGVQALTDINRKLIIKLQFTGYIPANIMRNLSIFLSSTGCNKEKFGDVLRRNVSEILGCQLANAF